MLSLGENMRITGYVVIAVLFVTSTAHAVCPYPTPKICSEYFENDVVFVGKILEAKYVSDPKQDNDSDWIQYTAEVIRVYRGHVDSITAFRTYNGSARWIGIVGKTYVVFLRGGETGATCGPLDEPEYVNRVERDIARLKTTSSATIGGQVFSKSGPWGGGKGIPVEGVLVKVIGKSKEYASHTDKEGKFMIVLPPGTYRLDAPNMQPSDYNYKHQDLQEISVMHGQCAQFELLKEK